MIEIENRYTGEVVYTSESAATIREAVIEAVSAYAYLEGANLRDANLAYANLAYANLAYAYLPEYFASREEAVALLDRVRDVVLANPSCLDMSQWHCGTSHCIAGWVQELSGDTTGSADAVGLKRAWPAAHMFYATNEDALRFLTDRGYAK